MGGTRTAFPPPCIHPPPLNNEVCLHEVHPALTLFDRSPTDGSNQD